MGVWIETSCESLPLMGVKVTPFVGVWIETWTISSSCMKIRVTPFVCVWIETPLPYHLFLRLPNHTLRGCMDWNRKQILFSEPTWKSHFYENVPLIVNKLQRQKIWFGTFLKWTQFSIIQQTLVISVQNVSPPATAFVSSGHCIRLLQLSHSSPPVTAFDSFNYRIRLLRSPDSTPSATGFVSFS